MKKIVKVAAKILLGLVLLLAVLLLAHPLWLAPAARSVANSVVPGITKTEFNLGNLALNAYSGNFSVGDVLLGNPEGYDERVALKVGEVKVVADMGTVADDVIVLKEVSVKDVFLSYVYNGGVDNFTQISKNASSGDAQRDVSAQKQEAEGKALAEKKADAKTSGGSEKKSKKVIIDRLSLSGITVKLGPVPLPVPPITLTDIGRKSNGVTLAELGSQLFNAIMNGVGSAKDGLKVLGSLLGDGAADFTKQLEKVDVKRLQKTGGAVKDAAGALKSLFK
jgi:hypothetical protein